MKRRKRDEYKWSKIALKLIITHGRLFLSFYYAVSSGAMNTNTLVSKTSSVGER